MIGIPYAKWFASGGTTGVALPASLSALGDAMRIYGQGQTADRDERIRLGKQLYTMHADQVWSIGILGFGLLSYGFFIAKNNLLRYVFRPMVTKAGVPEIRPYDLRHTSATMLLQAGVNIGRVRADGTRFHSDNA